MEKMVPFWLAIATSLLTILTAAAGPSVYSCPSVCTCYVDENDGLRTANCSGVTFLSEYKYNKLFHEIEVLNLETDSDDDTISLWDGMFLSFTKLKLLNLSKCKINYLPKNVFKGLKKIYEIDLSYNNIKHFDNSVFENIYTLYKLSLRGNPLQASYKPFISSTSLRELDLGYCSMTVLQNEFFHGVKKVTRLHLDGNHLQTVKEHVLPRGVTHLNLASNRIVHVPISTISSLNHLRWINLGTNPINCTCSLLNLQDRLSGHGIIMDGDVRCAYPLELENVSWSKINENELCNKETFTSKLHYRKSQTSKYVQSQKKDQYFENEEYNPLESFQGDDPGLSADEGEYDLDGEGDDNPKETKTELGLKNNNNQDDNLEPPLDIDKKTEDNTGKDTDAHEVKENLSVVNPTLPSETEGAQPQNLLGNENVDRMENDAKKSEPEVETTNDGEVDDKKLEKQIAKPAEENKESEDNLKEISEINEQTVSEDKNSKFNIGDKEDEVDDKEFGGEDETTQITMTTDPDFLVPEVQTNEKSSLDSLDEDLKKEDEILPVAVGPYNESPLTAVAAKKETTGDNENIGKDYSNPENKDANDQNTSTENKNLEDSKDVTIHTESPIVKKNENENFSGNKNDIEENVDGDKVNHELTAGATEIINNEEKENHLGHIEGIEDGGENKSFGSAFDIKSEGELISSTLKTIFSNEEEGSGVEPFENTAIVGSIPVVPNDEKTISPETTLMPSSEIPVIINKNHTPVERVQSSGSDDANNESSRQIVDKESFSYASIGPYIVVAGIILLISVLVLVSLYKGLCKPNKNNRKPVLDVEATSNGTELQDMKSLLPQTPMNGEKHNNKYPNEVPSPETVNLIKDDKNEDTHIPNETHDLNQNDNTNEPVVKNGKAPEGSPLPVVMTKAKLTVLHESIPQTPKFVQKRPETVN